MPDQAPATVRLAALGRAIGSRGLDPVEQHAATRVVLDWYGATISGCEMEPAVMLVAALVNDQETGPAHLVGSDRRVPVRVAAMVNGVASHTAELDDIYREGVYHPGSPTVAAALALAEKLGVPGSRLLRAVTVGYEIGDRIAATIQPAHYEHWHTTGTVGTIGAAAAAADLLDLDESAFAHALASATTMAAGLQQAFRSDAMSKPLHAGHAAEAGLLAAMSAQQGFTGALDVIDGPVGFGAALSNNPDWDKVAEPTGPLLVTQATVKNHSCCGHTFAAVDAALELREQGLLPSDVDSAEVRTYTTATKVAGNIRPQTAFEAKFSNSYCVAAALALGSVRLQAFLPSALEDPTIRDLEGRITVLPDEDMQRVFPGERHASLVVRTRDGRELAAHRHTRKGDPDDPLTDDELADKFVDLSEPVLGSARTIELVERLWELAGLDDVRRLEQ